jgi:putative oligomerization/nucleic acid binding protein
VGKRRRRLQEAYETEERVLATGLPAQGTIRDLHEVRVTEERPEVALELSVELPGHQPYRANVRKLFARAVVPRLAPGATLPLRVDPGDLGTVFVDEAAIWGQRSSAPPDQSARAPIKRDEPLEKLERLAELRDAGVLTEQEFTAKKAELLQGRF